MVTKTEVPNHFIRQIVNAIAYVALVVITVCGGSLPYNNNYLMEVVARYNPDFMVAAYSGYVLDVLIYIFLLCFVVYQAFAHRRNDRVIRSIDYLFIMFVAAKIVWTFGFFYNVQGLAFVGMIIAAVAAFFIYHRLGIGRDKVTRANYWCVHFPFSLIAAATLFGVVSQISMFCIAYDLVWWGVGETAWTVVAMLVVGFFGSMFLQLRPDSAFGCAVVWLSAGLAVYQMHQHSTMLPFAYLLVLYFAILTFANGMHRPRLCKKDTK